MFVNKSIIQKEFTPLSGSDLVGEVKARFEAEGVAALPVVDSTTKKLIGQVSKPQLEDVADDQMISSLQMAKAVKVFEKQHIFEAARLMLQQELQLLPLVDKESTFLGIINSRQMFESIAQMLNLEQQGSVVMIEVEPIDFSMSEIVQLIEAEGAKIMGVAVENPDHKERAFHVSVKLNFKDISRITAALKRYGYSVLSESESTMFENDLENRADELLKYIDM